MRSARQQQKKFSDELGEIPNRNWVDINGGEIAKRRRKKGRNFNTIQKFVFKISIQIFI